MACTGDWITKPMQSIVSKKERNRAIVESLETLRLIDKDACTCGQRRNHCLGDMRFSRVRTH